MSGGIKRLKVAWVGSSTGDAHAFRKHADGFLVTYSECGQKKETGWKKVDPGERKCVQCNFALSRNRR